MAYDTSAHVTLGQLQTALTRVKYNYELAIEESKDSIATTKEVESMLKAVFGEDEESDSTE